MASSCGDGRSSERDSHYRRRDAAGGLDHTTVAADSNRFRQPSGYKTGTQAPFLSSLADEAHRAGALFCVDATQALGRVPVSVEGVDYLVASSYKWLLGTHGLGLVYMSQEARQQAPPRTAGWYSVESVFHPRRFETFSQKSSAGSVAVRYAQFSSAFRY